MTEEGKDVLVDFIDEITSRFISCKYRKAPIIMSAIDKEKQNIQPELDEYVKSQSQYIKVYETESSIFEEKIKNLQDKISFL